MDQAYRADFARTVGGAALASLVAQRVKLARSGRDWKGLCPFHNEKTPSFTVFEDGHYHCFGCGAHGDEITWHRKIEGLSFAEARERAGDSPRQTHRPRERGAGRYAAKLLASSTPIAGTIAE